MSTNLANLLYLIPIVAFILALRFLSNPAQARRGNQIGAVGMLVAIVVTWIKAGRPKIDIALAIALSGLIGAISFAGSMIAFAKLQELIRGRPITYPGQQFGNLLLIAAIVGCGIAIVAGAERQW